MPNDAVAEKAGSAEHGDGATVCCHHDSNPPVHIRASPLPWPKIGAESAARLQELDRDAERGKVMESPITSQAESEARKQQVGVELAFAALVLAPTGSIELRNMPRGRVLSWGFAALTSLLCYFGASSPSLAQDTSALDARTLAGFAWKKDVSIGNELAASRSDSSFNFFDVGDLSYYSLYLVDQDIRRLAAAAGLTIDHRKNSSVAIVHDPQVFARLKSDKSAFKSLGFSDYEIETLEKQVTSDSPKCLTMTVTDGNNRVVSTVVLLSEKFDDCLVRALLSSFGITASDINAETLIDVCVLYEGRRLGLRDRHGLAREASRLRNVCIAKAGEIK